MHLETEKPETPPIKLTSPTFVGREMDADTTVGATNFLEKSNVPLPPELPKSPEQLQQLDAMRDALAEFGKDLGIDLTQRLPSNEKIHFINPKVMDQYREDQGMPKTIAGHTRFDNELIVSTEYGPAVTAVTTSHEMVHSVAHFTHQPKVVESGAARLEIARSGYHVHKTGALRFINETVTEAMSREIMKDYWPRFPELKELSKGHLFVVDEQLPLMEAVVNEVAEKSGKQSNEIWHDLYRGALTGDMTPLVRLSSHLTHDQFKTLTHSTETLGGAQEINELAQKLKLSHYVMQDVAPPK